MLVLLAVAHYGYEPLALRLHVDPGRIFYIFQGVVGALFFILAGLTLHRPHWPEAARLSLYGVAWWGLVEQGLVASCGCARLYERDFHAPRGQGLCGEPWSGIGLAVVAWLAMLVWMARKVER